MQGSVGRGFRASSKEHVATLALEQAFVFDDLVKQLSAGETALPAGACFVAITAVAHKLNTFLKVQGVEPRDLDRLEKAGQLLGERLIERAPWRKEIA